LTPPPPPSSSAPETKSSGLQEEVKLGLGFEIPSIFESKTESKQPTGFLPLKHFYFVTDKTSYSVFPWRAF
jgi:hypothetical protein